MYITHPFTRIKMASKKTTKGGTKNKGAFVRAPKKSRADKKKK